MKQPPGTSAKGAFMLKNTGIRNKLLISYSIIFILSFSLGSVFIYFFARQNITTVIENELRNNTSALLNMIKTTADVSIKVHLRTVAEKNHQLVDSLYGRFQSGAVSEAEAKKLAATLLLSQTIGQSGYLYCLDSTGTVLVHPQPKLLNNNISDRAFIQKQITLKKGYLEYDWQNPGETLPRPKAVYMTYFAPWDWIICASSYRHEFKGLVNAADFQDSRMPLKFGRTGHSYVLDKEGAAVVKTEQNNSAGSTPQPIPLLLVQEMIARQNGKQVYSWQNPDENRPSRKLVFFNFLPQYDWIVASSIHLEEFYGPLDTIRNLIIATVAVMLILVIPITFEISSSITKPLGKLMHYFDHMKTGDFSYRMETGTLDEIGQLAGHFNHFMHQLELYSSDLQKEIIGRKRVEQALRESESRYRSVMAAAPDPIVIYDMQGRVTYINPAFTSIFGWRPDECMGRTMDHFVPEENWPETRMMIHKVLSGEPLSGIETRRYTKQRRIVWVSISGATFRDRNDQLAGSVIILRDVTTAKHLEQQVMRAGDHERQRIGQDLHDDLCPHLIGIEGLCAVLAQNLKEKKSPDTPLAETIGGYIGDAIQKARDLARGLCPVHLVAHGLETTLEEFAKKTQAAAGIDCSFTCDDSVDFRNNTIATHLFYIALEAVTNAVKHAAAKKIEISLKQENDTIHMTVRDDGRGIAEKGAGRGMGLQIIRRRAHMIGATVRIEKGPHGGTIVTASIKKALADKPAETR